MAAEQCNILLALLWQTHPVSLEKRTHLSAAFSFVNQLYTHTYMWRFLLLETASRQSKYDVCFMANSVFRSNLFSSFTTFTKQVMDDGGDAGGNNRSVPAWFHFHPVMDETAWKLKASTLWWRANPSGWIILCKPCLVCSSWVINNFLAPIPQASDDIFHHSWTARLTVSYQGGGTHLVM